MKKLKNLLIHFAKEFDKYFLKLLPKTKHSLKLHNAMKYSISVGGKRLKASIFLRFRKFLGVPKKMALRAAASIELNPLLFSCS